MDIGLKQVYVPTRRPLYTLLEIGSTSERRRELTRRFDLVEKATATNSTVETKFSWRLWVPMSFRRRADLQTNGLKLTSIQRQDVYWVHAAPLHDVPSAFT